MQSDVGKLPKLSILPEMFKIMYDLHICDDKPYYNTICWIMRD
jgi:hypothetical protein